MGAAILDLYIWEMIPRAMLIIYICYSIWSKSETVASRRPSHGRRHFLFTPGVYPNSPIIIPGIFGIFYFLPSNGYVETLKRLSPLASGLCRIFSLLGESPPFPPWGLIRWETPFSTWGTMGDATY
jgi:hypothetical protein